VSRNAKEHGTYGTTEYKLSVTHRGNVVSPWHDIPLYADDEQKIVNFVVEIPMYSTAKMEVNKAEANNVIMQDVKNGAPRYYSYGTPFFNYGLLPQTWEDSTHVDPVTGAKGDNDPIDAIEIGNGPLHMGEVVACKVLGAMELIDEGETDHKIIVLRSTDPLFHQIHNVHDLDRYRPNTIKKLVDWLKNYKTSDGKPQNRLAQDEPTTPVEALEIIREVNGFYNNLLAGDVDASISSEFYLPSNAVTNAASSIATSKIHDYNSE
jgi:3'-phosphoadenosine 5'-phosphosulfate synthase